MSQSIFPKIVVIVALLGLAGCLYPLGMTENEWLALSPQQQLDARYKQAEIDRERAQRRAEETRRKEAEERRLAKVRQRRVDRLYARNRHGDILRCTIEGGMFDFKPGWRQLAPVSFSVARGEQGHVMFRQLNGGKEKQVWVEYSDDGNALTICHDKNHYECAAIGGSQRDFSRGLHIYPSNFKGVMHSNQIDCGF